MAVIVSFSGGPDSVYLVDFLSQSVKSADIILVYFNHQLRSESAIKCEVQFIIKYAQYYKYKLIVKKIPVIPFSKINKVSIETAARHLRRCFLEHYAKLYDVKNVYMGHHLDDWCETFLHRVIRGAKTKIGAFNAIERLSDKVSIVRPLLHLRKKDILEFLSHNNSSFVIDETNQELNFTRNKIRHQLMPSIESINPSYTQQLWGLGQYLNEQRAYLLQTMQNILDQIHVEEDALSIDSSTIKEAPVFVQKQVIYHLLTNYQIKKNGNKRLEFKERWHVLSAHVEEVYRQSTVFFGDASKKVSICLPDGYVFNCHLGVLKISKRKENQEIPPYSYAFTDIKNEITIIETGKIIKFAVLDNQGDDYISSKTKMYLAYDKVKGSSFFIRSRLEGDKFRPFGCSYDCKIKDYFIDKKIPKGYRDLVPLFFVQNHLACVIGYQVSELFRITKETKQVLLISLH